jgi:hypothetical protein
MIYGSLIWRFLILLSEISTFHNLEWPPKKNFLDSASIGRSNEIPGWEGVVNCFAVLKCKWTVVIRAS